MIKPQWLSFNDIYKLQSWTNTIVLYKYILSNQHSYELIQLLFFLCIYIHLIMHLCTHVSVNVSLCINNCVNIHKLNAKRVALCWKTYWDVYNWFYYYRKKKKSSLYTGINSNPKVIQLQREITWLIWESEAILPWKECISVFF